MNKHERMAAALRGQPVDRTPVWFMRQAGRYLPEYMEIRSKVSFLELCGDPDLACEVTLQPLRRFKLDAAIVFSDILPVVEAIGREVTFEKGHGPRLPNPVRCAADAAELVRPDVSDALHIVPKTLDLFRKLKPDTPILGFAGAPFTLLCYLVEGGGSKSWKHTKQLLLSDPKTAHMILALLADTVGDYLQLQMDHGAAAVQIFDTWAGILSPEDYQTWALPYAQRALARASGVPKMYFTRDSAPFLKLLPTTGADVIGLDWRVDIGEARKVLGDMPVQGNLDPISLYGPNEEITRRVHKIMRAAGPTGHIFNLGHGVQPDTPITGVHAMIEAVHSYRSTEA